MSIAATLREKLSLALAPQELDVVDDSARHAGHAGAKPEGETHFSIRIVSSRFEGLDRLSRQRMVYATVSGELRTQVHALSLTTLTPAEASSR